MADRRLTGRRALVACLAGLAACAAVPIELPLAGTAWRLTAIQSMDDAQGTTPITDPSRYTLRFDADGRAALRLDCNRATGSWTAQSAGDHTGSLRLGPIAATLMACPPPTLGERLVRDLGYVRGYRLADGKLFLSLMADGGILEWVPEPLTRP